MFGTGMFGTASVVPNKSQILNVEIFGQEESNTTSKIRLSYSARHVYENTHCAETRKFYALLQAVDCSIKKTAPTIIDCCNLHLCAIFTYTTNTIPGKKKKGKREKNRTGLHDWFLNTIQGFGEMGCAASRLEDEECQEHCMGFESKGIQAQLAAATLKNLAKLYKEVKAGERLRIEYEKRLTHLRNQDVKGEEPTSVDKICAALRSLHTRLKVSIHTVQSVSRRIEILRDEELHPQLMELILDTETISKHD
ncbi:hypothetical protein ACJX0J_035941, partial [Zea mays]